MSNAVLKVNKVYPITCDIDLCYSVADGAFYFRRWSDKRMSDRFFATKGKAMDALDNDKIRWED